VLALPFGVGIIMSIISLRKLRAAGWRSQVPGDADSMSLNVLPLHYGVPELVIRQEFGGSFFKAR
jgi:hypothetical protein